MTPRVGIANQRENPHDPEQLIRGGSKCGKILTTTVLLDRQFPISHPPILSRPLIAGRKICIHNGPIDDVRYFEYLAACQMLTFLRFI